MAKEIRPLNAHELQTIVEDPMCLELRDDLVEVVRALPLTTFVTVTRQLIKEQRLDLLVPHATPTQLRAVVDFDGWKRDRLDTASSRAWLAKVCATLVDVQAPRGTLTALMHGMDIELWVLALMATTAVAEAEPDDDEWRDRAAATMETLATYESPDGNYIVGVPDDEIGRQALAIIDAAYQDDLANGAKLVRYIKYSLGASLEDEQHRWRAGRLADEGFPSWEQAMRLFAPMSRNEAVGADEASGNADRPRSPEAAPEATPDAASALILQAPRPLFAKLLGMLDTHARGVRGREFLLLVNELMAAQRFEPGDQALQTRAVDQAQATINLGLELLSAEQGDEDPWPFLLARMEHLGMRGLFRVGYRPLRRLREASMALHRSGQVSLSHPGSLLDRPWGPWLRALLEWFPEAPAAAPAPKGVSPQAGDDGKEHTPRPAAATRPLDTRAAVAAATQALGQAGALAQLTFDPRGFGVAPIWVSRVDEPARLRLGDLIRTALVHAKLPGSAGRMAPLTPDDLTWARAHLRTDDGALVPDVHEELRARMEAVGAEAHVAQMMPALLTRLSVELGGLEQDEQGAPRLDAVGGLISIQQVSMWLKTGVEDGVASS